MKKFWKNATTQLDGTAQIKSAMTPRKIIEFSFGEKFLTPEGASHLIGSHTINPSEK
jgi:hypothetical protein